MGAGFCRLNASDGERCDFQGAHFLRVVFCWCVCGGLMVERGEFVVVVVVVKNTPPFSNLFLVRTYLAIPDFAQIPMSLRH
jgi:hypothetical protein